MGRPDIHALRDQAGALRHPVMMAVDRERGLPQGREGRDRGARLGADPGDAFEPGARFPDGHVAEEVQAESPCRSPMARSTACTRGAFCSGQVTPAIAASTSSVGRVPHGRPIGIACPQRLVRAARNPHCASGGRRARTRVRSAGHRRGNTGSGSHRPRKAGDGCRAPWPAAHEGGLDSCVGESANQRQGSDADRGSSRTGLSQRMIVREKPETYRIAPSSRTSSSSKG